MNPFLAALGTIIQPAIVYAEQKLASIGAAFLGGLAVIGNAFTNDQRAEGSKLMAFWQAHYHANVAAGDNEITAIEKATTASLNEFCNDEAAEFTKIGSAIITLLETSVKNGLATP